MTVAEMTRRDVLMRKMFNGSASASEYSELNDLNQKISEEEENAHYDFLAQEFFAEMEYYNSIF